jgi:hypothetical protein
VDKGDQINKTLKVLLWVLQAPFYNNTIPTSSGFMEGHDQL